MKGMVDTMTVQEIERLADLMKEKGLSSLEWAEGDTSLKLTMGGVSAAAAIQTSAQTAGTTAVAAAAVAASPAPEAGNLMKAPMVGVLYLAPSPGAKPFVGVGSRVKKGDVLCIIEAMKLMNEIAAEQDGEILEICAEDGQIVEFGQPLFRLG